VFHYLRSGLADFEQDEIDRLENYVLALGIKGRKKWSEAFTRNSKAAVDEEEQLLLMQKLNHTRNKLMEQLSPLLEKKETAGEYVRTLYDFIVRARVQEKLTAYENYFRSCGDRERAREFAQVYRLVMELFEQIEGLLQDETMTMQEFADILDAGFGEIEVGIIPGTVDRVVVGDMERTRLKQVRVLFFLGVNDGNIPGNNLKGGIISDIDREFLQESGFELAPAPRQKMYIQRLYLYMNMTKPSEQLHLSYARVSAAGKSLRPSYLIGMLQQLYPDLEIGRQDKGQSLLRLVGPKDGLSLLADELRRYREGSPEGSKKLAASLLQIYREREEYGQLTEKMTEAAFRQYQHSPLSKMVAAALYGSVLENSVSRLERYAACAYSHFLQYGLMLKEREEYSFEVTDLGNVYHSVLELFAGKLAENHYTWLDFPEEEGDRLLKEALISSAASYGETILYSNARYEYLIERMYQILKRTIRTLKSQLAGGSFTPAHFEMSFSKVENLETVNIALTEQEKMKLRGRIDRIDTCEDEEHVYVKVIDYKSGSKKFNLAALYYGLQLQLVVYMNVAAEAEKKNHPEKEIVPAALLYYHVENPMIKEEKDMSPEEVNDRILRELRTTGMVSSDEKVISLLDKGFTDKSLLIPVERKKDGSFTASSNVISREDYEAVSAFVTQKMKQFGREILAGNISVNPCETETGTACTYCAYKGVCSFDEKVPGFEIRHFPKLTEDEWMLKIREESKGEKPWQ
jgi:ATP-dependent helicase/nuclease subunit B